MVNLSLYDSYTIYRYDPARAAIKSMYTNRRTHGPTDRRIDGHGYFDSFVDVDLEYIYFIGSEMFRKVRCELLAKMYPLQGYKKEKTSEEHSIRSTLEIPCIEPNIA